MTDSAAPSNLETLPFTSNDTSPPPSPDAASGLSLSRREMLFLSLFILLAFLWKYSSIANHNVISADGTSYCLSGKQFFTDWQFTHFGTVFPPLYPLLIGLFNLVLDNLELSARLVSVVFSTLTIIPVYLLGRVRLGRAGGAIMCLLFTLLPLVHSMSAIDIAEPVYTFFMICGALLVWQGIQAPGTRRGMLYGAGVALGMAFLARPESFVTLFSLSLLMVGLTAISDRRFILTTITGLIFCWAGFFTLAFPYMSFLHSQTGVWQLSGKTGINVNMIKEYNGLAITDQRFQLNEKGEYVEQKGSLTELMLQEPRLFASLIRKNVAEFVPVLRGVMPDLIWVFVVAGLLLPPWRGVDLRYKLFVLATLSPILLYIVFYVVSRYMYPYLPLLLFFFAAALLRMDQAFARRTALPPARAAFCLTAALAAYFIYQEIPRPRPPYNYEQDGGRYDDKQVGLRLAKMLPKDSVLMTRSGRIAFYAGMPMIIPPQAEPARILEYARKNRVTHMVVNVQLVGMRPQLEYLFTPVIQPGAPFTPPPGMQVVYIGEEPGGLPYIIYRLL